MGPILQTQQYLSHLLTFAEGDDTLERHGHVTQHLTDEQLLLKQRCSRCNKTLVQMNKDEARMEVKRKALERKKAAKEDVATSPYSTSGTDGYSTASANKAEDETPENTYLCQFHPGTVVNKHWTCCSQHVAQKPCAGTYAHSLHRQSLHDLSSLYQFHTTPPFRPYRGSSMRAAVALDCEMGTAESGDVELIRISMVDYFTGEILINSLVQPSVRMAHLNTKYSGVTFADLNNARRAGKCLRGTDGARRAVWSYIGPETVVIGHGVGNDLRALKWLHANIVDSYVIEFKKVKMEEEEKKAREEEERKVQEELNLVREAAGLHIEEGEKNGKSGEGNHGEGGDGLGELKEMKKKTKGSGRLSLKTMMKECLNKEIQTGKRGHDSLEDAVAARELVHWLITHPERG
ncbi:hypothetical protein DE146DRAFT_638153 [Phaeosphaeria sp. MPI-PUGE-AT-0046c]|nr:hypothetical protein DE146DRAFT_638153 [Phaeosphaeria sp. MPI-PUGE-AT-0046c]